MYEPGASSSSSAGSEPALEDLTKAELQQLAEERGLEVPSSASKAELRAALEE